MCHEQFEENSDELNNSKWTCYLRNKRKKLHIFSMSFTYGLQLGQKKV